MADTSALADTLTLAGTLTSTDTSTSTDTLTSINSNIQPCALRAWQEYEHVLLQWLFNQTHDKALVEDISQDVFIKVIVQQEKFCTVQNPKAWLFRVAKNALIDHIRHTRFQLLDLDLVSSDIAQQENLLSPVDLLALSCLPRVISELESRDRDILIACDLGDMSQQEFADTHDLTLAATKSRIRRAREKLKDKIQTECQVKLDENQKICCFTARDK
ncbi:sigma-70 family RNA polymerase sigma factor [Vibrio sp. MA40-2]|uniref:sigma-70 family RNA polymerase sigma factor n=1 Tax=Vibrio sp. MA40-2 TaxID=3391828 RepID=UPI0039A50DFE